MSRETSMPLAIQRRTAGPRTVPVAKLLGRAGKHAAAWIAAGLVGTVPDSRTRQQWLRSLQAVAASHGSSGVLPGVAQGTAVAAAAPVGRTVRRR